MAKATDEQVQRWANERARVRAEQIRALYLALKDDRAGIEDVYQALAQANPTWADSRTDGPPRLLGKNDLLAMNAFAADLTAWMEARGDLALLQSMCVRPVTG